MKRKSEEQERVFSNPSISFREKHWKSTGFIKKSVLFLIENTIKTIPLWSDQSLHCIKILMEANSMKESVLSWSIITAMHFCRVNNR